MEGNERGPALPGVIDPEAMAAAAAEVAAVIAAAGGHVWRSWQECTRVVCWTAIFLSWPAADLMRRHGWPSPAFGGLAPRALIFAAPFAATLLALFRHGRLQRAAQQAAWSGRHRRAIGTLDGGRGDICEACEERCAGVEAEMRALCEGLAAMREIARLPEPRPHLRAVPPPAVLRRAR